jgi:hypothetical protein
VSLLCELSWYSIAFSAFWTKIVTPTLKLNLAADLGNIITLKDKFDHREISQQIPYKRQNNKNSLKCTEVVP